MSKVIVPALLVSFSYLAGSPVKGITCLGFRLMYKLSKLNKAFAFLLQAKHLEG